MSEVSGLRLPLRYRAMVQEILNQYLPDSEVWVYGSRARGDHHDTSDLDLVVRNPLDLTQPCGAIVDAREAFSQSNLPIMVQIVDWARIPAEFHAEILAAYRVLKSAGHEVGTLNPPFC